ncbi:MAG TPA: sugar dehydrogenase complex small subunit [Thermomicrobiales bacterium]|nr:sugar dehydrogenase complex small subunit [Thermomicrobiales bacterium]
MPADDKLPDRKFSSHGASLASRLTRRRFLAVAGAAIATGILAACMDDDEDDGETVNARDGTPTLVGATRTPDSAIETPQVGASPTGTTSASPPAGDEADSELERFMVLSRALTGFDDLDDTELGQVYLDSIASSDELGDQLDALYEKAGLTDDVSAVTLEDLESAGAFDDDTRPVADSITTAWYTGRYDAGGGELVVATYINALAWKATGYRLTGPSSCSGATGNWTAAAAA